jgi:two-component system, NtrC family, response regulator HydG
MELPCILVLDDEIGICTILSKILRDQQYDVHAIQSVARASKAVAERSFDAYLLDYRLQDGTGLQIAEKVRQNGSSAPIILISGYGAVEIGAKAKALDIFDVLEKPFNCERIRSTISQALGTNLLPVPKKVDLACWPIKQIPHQVQALTKNVVRAEFLSPRPHDHSYR